MSNPFTDVQMAVLSAEIDEQLRAISAGLGGSTLKSGTRGTELPEKQSRAIEQATGENPKTFLKKFRLAARQDLCEEGGVLNAQWKKWGDLSNDRVLAKFGGILGATFGLSGSALQITVVALAVIVLHIGVKAFCMQDET